MAKKYVVELSEGERARLRTLVGSGTAAARTLTHARMLLKADQGEGGPGWTDAAIAGALDVGLATVARVRQAYATAGLAAALTAKVPEREYARTFDVEALLSEKRDMAAAQRFFACALEVAGHAPEQVTTDGHDAYPRAIRETLGPEVSHRCSRYKNNPIEQDHRAVKQRYYPMRGFGSFASAARFCPAFEEQRQFFRAVAQRGERVSLAERRGHFQERWATVMAELAAA